MVLEMQYYDIFWNLLPIQKKTHVLSVKTYNGWTSANAETKYQRPLLSQ